MNAAYSSVRRVYVRHSTKQALNFGERRQHEVRRKPLPRSPVNSCRSRQRAGCLVLPLEPRHVERHAEPLFWFGHVRDGGVAVLRSTDDFADPHFPGKKEEQPARVPRGQSRFPPDLLDLLLPHVQTPLYCIGGGDPAKDLGFNVASERDLRRTLYDPLLSAAALCAHGTRPPIAPSQQV